MRGGDARHGGLRSARTTLLVVVLVIAALGYGGFVAYDTGYLDRYLTRSPDTTSPAELPPPSGLAVPDVPPPAAVLEPAAGAPPRPRALARALAADLRDPNLGRHVGVLVADLETGAEVLRVGRGPFTPASTLKILTAVAALERLGPEHRFTTRVLHGAAPDEIVLVGGGDPLLTSEVRRSANPYPVPATTAVLARRTATSLASAGTTAVRLRFDESLFSGPAVSPAWRPSYVPDNVVTPISALWVDEGLPDGGRRSENPARQAAEVFARQLADQGIEVIGPIRRATTQVRGRQVAAVQSPPLSQIAARTLLVSDNEAAEVLLRHIGLAAGRPGSFQGGAHAMVQTLTDLGVDLRGARIFDGSGLARGNRLRLDAIVGALRVAAAPQNQHLRAAVTGLPVAGFSGSLTFRFPADRRPQTAAALGVVRAKTGTLTGVHGLAGVVLDRDGAALAYAAIADRVRVEDTLDARAELEDLSAAIAGCCS